MVTTGQYNGCPTLSLPLNGKYKFTFGLNKAQAIAKYYDQILEFINGQTMDPTPVDAPFTVPDYEPETRSLMSWIKITGGVKDTSLPGEIKDLITGEHKGKRAKGIIPGFLNNKTGRGLDEVVTEANSDGWMIRDEGHLLEMLEAEQKEAYSL